MTIRLSDAIDTGVQAHVFGVVRSQDVSGHVCVSLCVILRQSACLLRHMDNSVVETLFDWFNSLAWLGFRATNAKETVEENK